MNSTSSTSSVGTESLGMVYKANPSSVAVGCLLVSLLQPKRGEGCCAVEAASTAGCAQIPTLCLGKASVHFRVYWWQRKP